MTILAGVKKIPCSFFRYRNLFDQRVKHLFFPPLVTDGDKHHFVKEKKTPRSWFIFSPPGSIKYYLKWKACELGTTWHFTPQYRSEFFNRLWNGGVFSTRKQWVRWLIQYNGRQPCVKTIILKEFIFILSHTLRKYQVGGSLCEFLGAEVLRHWAHSHTHTHCPLFDYCNNTVMGSISNRKEGHIREAETGLNLVNSQRPHAAIMPALHFDMNAKM